MKEFVKEGGRERERERETEILRTGKVRHGTIQFLLANIFGKALFFSIVPVT